MVQIIPSRQRSRRNWT